MCEIEVYYIDIMSARVEHNGVDCVVHLNDPEDDWSAYTMPIRMYADLIKNDRNVLVVQSQQFPDVIYIYNKP